MCRASAGRECPVVIAIFSTPVFACPRNRHASRYRRPKSQIGPTREKTEVVLSNLDEQILTQHYYRMLDQIEYYLYNQYITSLSFKEINYKPPLTLGK